MEEQNNNEQSLMKTEYVQENKKIPWDKLDDENEKFYFVFCRYLDMSTGRSYSKVAQAVGITKRTVVNLAKRFNWQSRALQFDQAMYSSFRKSARETLGSYNDKKIEQKISIAATIQNTAREILPYLQLYDKYFESPDVLKKIKYVRSLMRLLSDSVKMSDFSVINFANDSMQNEMEIANLLKARLDPEWMFKELPDGMGQWYGQLRRKYFDELENKKKYEQNNNNEQSYQPPLTKAEADIQKYGFVVPEEYGELDEGCEELLRGFNYEESRAQLMRIEEEMEQKKKIEKKIIGENR